MLETYPSYTNTDAVVIIPVTFDPGAAISSLAGATLDARGRSTNGTITVGDTALNLGGDRITVTFLGGTLPPGKCNVQVWAQAGVQRMMIKEFNLDVRKGYKPIP